jgi:hypothetical protein
VDVGALGLSLSAHGRSVLLSRLGKKRTATRRRQSAAVNYLAALPAALTLSVSSPLRAESQEAPALWQFSVTPYVWLPHIDTTLDFDTPGTGGSPVSMSDILKYLSGAFFLSGEARKNRWGLALDLVYCDFSKAASKVSSVGAPDGMVEVPVNAGTTTTLGGTMVSLTGSYSLQLLPQVEFDLLGGLRYTHIGATLHWDFAADVADLPERTGSASQGVDLWDGVVGFRGSARLGDGKWFVPYYLDVGAGTSKFTWQALLGIGYSFGWGDLVLVYRYLSFEQGDDQPVQRLEFAGPALGVTFRF